MTGQQVNFLGLCRDGETSAPDVVTVLMEAQSYLLSYDQAQYKSKLHCGKIRDVLEQGSVGFSSLYY